MEPEHASPTERIQPFVCTGWANGKRSIARFCGFRPNPRLDSTVDNGLRQGQRVV